MKKAMSPIQASGLAPLVALNVAIPAPAMISALPKIWMASGLSRNQT